MPDLPIPPGLRDIIDVLAGNDNQLPNPFEPRRPANPAPVERGAAQARQRNTSWQTINGRRVLVDDITGDVISDAGPASTPRETSYGTPFTDGAGNWYRQDSEGNIDALDGMEPRHETSRPSQRRLTAINGTMYWEDPDTGTVTVATDSEGRTLRNFANESPTYSGGGRTSGGGGGGGSSINVGSSAFGGGNRGQGSLGIGAGNAADDARAAADRAERAREFDLSHGLDTQRYQDQLAQYQETRQRQLAQDRLDAADRYARLVSTPDLSALPAFLAAGGGNLMNAISSGATALTDAAITPGAIALQQARNLGATGPTQDPFKIPALAAGGSVLPVNKIRRLAGGGDINPALRDEGNDMLFPPPSRQPLFQPPMHGGLNFNEPGQFANQDVYGDVLKGIKAGGLQPYSPLAERDQADALQGQQDLQSAAADFYGMGAGRGPQFNFRDPEAMAAAERARYEQDRAGILDTIGQNMAWGTNGAGWGDRPDPMSAGSIASAQQRAAAADQAAWRPGASMDDWALAGALTRTTPTAGAGNYYGGGGGGVPVPPIRHDANGDILGEPGWETTWSPAQGWHHIPTLLPGAADPSRVRQGAGAGWGIAGPTWAGEGPIYGRFPELGPSGRPLEFDLPHAPQAAPGRAYADIAAQGGIDLPTGQFIPPGEASGQAPRLPAALPRGVTPRRIYTAPKRATGGPIQGLGIVGDSLDGRPNPELVIAPKGAQVIPLHGLGKHGAGGDIDPTSISPGNPVLPDETGYMANPPPAPAKTPDPFTTVSGSSVGNVPVGASPIISPAGLPISGNYAPAALASPPLTRTSSGLIDQWRQPPPGGNGLPSYLADPSISPGNPVLPDETGYMANPPPAARPPANPSISPFNPANPMPPPGYDGGSRPPVIPVGGGGRNQLQPVTPNPFQPPSLDVFDQVRRFRQGQTPVDFSRFGTQGLYDIENENRSPDLLQEMYNQYQTGYGVPASTVKWDREHNLLTGPRRRPTMAAPRFEY